MNIHRTIFILNETFNGILKTRIITKLDELKLKIEIYKILNMSNTITESISTNPNNELLFDGINKELIGYSVLSLSNCEKYIINLRKTINPNEKYTILYIPLRINNDKSYGLKIETYKAISFYNFIEQFTKYYDIFKIKIIEENNKIDIESVKIIEDVPSILIKHQITDKNEITEPEKIDDNGLLYDILLVTSNNLIRYYILKKIQSHKNSLIFVVKKDNLINISINPYITTNLLCMSNDEYDIINLIDTISGDKDYCLKKIKVLVHSIFYICNEYNKNDVDKDLYSVCINTIYFIIVLYIMKMSIKKIYQNNITILNIVNDCIDYVIKTYYPNETKIVFIHNNINSDIIENEIIYNLLSKHRQLLNIDNNMLISDVLLNYKSEINNYQTTFNRQLNYGCVFINKPKYINIKSILNNCTDNIDNYTNYKLIEVDDNEFKDNKIITSDYKDLLSIINIPISSRVLNIGKINNIIRLNYDNIINIFKKISNDINSNNMIYPIQTTDLLLNYFKNGNDIKIDLYILFKIVIPYIYDIHNIEDYIDYLSY